MRNLKFRIVSMFMVLTMLFSMVSAVNAAQYRDDGYWANEAIDFAINKGLLKGRDDGSIDSETYLTRAEMAAVVVRAFGGTQKADITKYGDLSSAAWYYDEFAKAVQMRVFEGDSSGLMRPNSNITREEVFTVIARAMVLGTDDYTYLENFGDAASISSWAKSSVSVLASKSYVNGDNDGNVNPKKNITRAEFAQLMYNIFKTYYSEAGSYENSVDEACVMINTKDVTLEKVSVNGDLVIGDGADLGTITLKNVKIDGRLLVRGSATVKLINTTVGEMVVVNNYNNVVHFDNYKTEKVFNGIVENTEATFKKRMSGGGGGGGTGPSVTTAQYKVEYYQKSLEDIDGNKVFDDYVLVSADTETLSGIVGDSVEVKEADVKDKYTGFDLSTSASVMKDTVKDDGSLVLKICYDREKYILTFDAGGDGVKNPDNVEALYGQEIVLPTVAKDNYEFQGWTDGKNIYEVGKKYTFTEAKDLDAIWVKKSGNVAYTVLYYIQDTDLVYKETVEELTGKLGETVKVKGPEEGFEINKYETNVLEGVLREDSKLVLKVYYGRIKYKLNFDAGDGVKDPDTLIAHHGVDVELPTVAKDDWTFKGWTDGTTTYTPGQKYTFKEDKNLKAEWEYTPGTIKYKAIYYVQDTELTYKETVKDLEGIVGTTVKVDAPLNGYVLEKNAMNITEGTLVRGQNLVLKVYYSRIKSTLTFDAGDGTKDPADITAYYGVELELPTVAKEDWTFKGWTDGTTTYAVGTKYIFTSDKALEAVWEWTPGTVSYKAIYYIQDTDLVYKETVKELSGTVGETVKVDGPEEGFVLETSAINVTEGKLVRGSDLVLKVYYSRIKSTLTFDAGDGAKDPADVTAYYGVELELPTVAKDDWTFKGWTDGTNTYDIGTKYTFKEGKNFTAIWEYTPGTIAYKAIYYVQDKNLVYQETVKPLSGTVGTTVEVDDPETGFELDITKGNVLSGTLVRGENLVLKVYYSRIKYNLTFDAGDGVTDPADVTAYYDVETELPTVAKDDWTFKGWTDGTTTYAVGTKYIFTSDKALEAVWEWTPGTIKYKAIYYIQDTDLTYKETVKELEDTVGTTVKVDDPELGFELDTTKTNLLEGKLIRGKDLVLTVYYKRSSYTLKFDAGDGVTNPADATVIHGVETELPTVSKEDWTFKGWTDGTTTYAVGTKYAFTEGKDLEAVWEYTPGQMAYKAIYYIQDTDLTYKETVKTPSATVGTTVKVDGPETGFELDATQPNVLEGKLERGKDLVLKVYYRRQQFTVTYDTDGGTPIADDVAYYGVNYTLPGLGSTEKDDKTLAGWLVDGVSYDLNGVVVNVTGGFTVKAVWKDAEYVNVNFYHKSTLLYGPIKVKKGSKMADADIPAIPKKGIVNYFVKDENISAVAYPDEYTHTIKFTWWYDDAGNWANFDSSVEINEDMDIYMMSPEVTVTVYVDKMGKSFPFSAYYEPETRFADTVKDILYGKDGTKLPLKALNETDYWETAKGKLIKRGIIDSNDNILIQNIMVKFSQVLGGKAKTRDFIVESAKASFGKNKALTDAFVIYAEDAAAAGGAESDEIHSLMKRAINFMLNEDAQCIADVKLTVEHVLNDENAFREMMVIEGYDPNLYDSMTAAQKTEVVNAIKDKIDVDGTEREQIVDIAINYLLDPSHATDLEYIVDHAMTYLGQHKDEPIVDKVIEGMYGDKIDTLVDELVNKDEFTITEDIVFVAEGLKQKLESEYDFDTFIKPQIPAKVWEIYPELKAREIYEKAIGRVLDQVDDALAVTIHQEAKIDSGLTAVINPVQDVYVPLYESLLDIIDRKAEGKYYYDQNIYVKELVKLLNPAVLFDGDISGATDVLSGYGIKGLDYYYNMIIKVAILGDDAMVWYTNNLTPQQIGDLTDDYEKLILKYANVFADIADRYASEGKLPNQKLSPIEQAIKDRYPDYVNKLVDKYLNSRFYNKDIDGIDYQRVQDAVKRAFGEVNMTTDEFFDKALSEAVDRVPERFDQNVIKVDENTYRLEAKDNTITITRELVDA